jgi:predicted lipid-binding transport protein (Tim44 family)
MTDMIDHQEQTAPAARACPAPPSRRRFLGAGLGAGLLGGVCCVGTAVAVGASVGGLSFFSTLMERYQIYFVVASLLLMALWLVRQIRRARVGGGSTAKAFLRAVWRQLAVMGVVYLVTLGIAVAAVAAVKHM